MPLLELAILFSPNDLTCFKGLRPPSAVRTAGLARGYRPNDLTCFKGLRQDLKTFLPEHGIQRPNDLTCFKGLRR